MPIDTTIVQLVLYLKNLKNTQGQHTPGATEVSSNSTDTEQAINQENEVPASPPTFRVQVAAGPLMIYFSWNLVICVPGIPVTSSFC